MLNRNLVMTAASLAAASMSVACGGVTPAGSVTTPTAAVTGRIDSGTVAIPHGRLFYQSVGTGPAVVLIPGGNLDSRMWEPQVAVLAREHRVIRYDARGFGRSSAADTPYQNHEDLRCLLDSLHVDQASLVGLSLGGRIALDFALANPKRVDKLVLASSGLSGFQFSPGDTSWLAEARVAIEKQDSVGIALAWLKTDYMSPAMEQSTLAPSLRQLITASSAGYWMGLLRHGDLELPALPPALGRTARVRAPTLVLVGSRDTPDITRIAETLGATMPNVRRVTLDGAGHLINLEQPGKFNELVADFLRP